MGKTECWLRQSTAFLDHFSIQHDASDLYMSVRVLHDFALLSPSLPPPVCRTHPALWGFNVRPTGNINFLVGSVSGVCYDGKNKQNTAEVVFGFNYTAADGTVSYCKNTMGDSKALQLTANGSWNYR